MLVALEQVQDAEARFSEDASRPSLTSGADRLWQGAEKL